MIEYSIKPKLCPGKKSVRRKNGWTIEHDRLLNSRVRLFLRRLQLLRESYILFLTRGFRNIRHKSLSARSALECASGMNVWWTVYPSRLIISSGKTCRSCGKDARLYLNKIFFNQFLGTPIHEYHPREDFDKWRSRFFRCFVRLSPSYIPDGSMDTKDVLVSCLGSNAQVVSDKSSSASQPVSSSLSRHPVSRVSSLLSTSERFPPPPPLVVSCIVFVVHLQIFIVQQDLCLNVNWKRVVSCF